MENNESAECPFCLARMQIRDQEGRDWMVCPNGCPTELEVLEPKPAASAAAAEPIRKSRAAGRR